MTEDAQAREKVIASLNNLMAQDKIHHISYLRGWRANLEKWLDCSGLIVYTLKQAGIIMDPTFTSRTAFKDFPIQWVEMNEDKKIKNNLKNIQQGDFLFWNSINPAYKRSTGPIPEITKNGKMYRVHHMAFIERINYRDGTIDIIESWSQWVAKNTINVQHCLKEMWDKDSELYVAHVNYTVLEQKKLVA